MSWEHLFFTGFQGRNLLVDDKNFKRDGCVKKREDQISRGSLDFLFHQSKLISHFDVVPVITISPDITLKERCRG